MKVSKVAFVLGGAGLLWLLWPGTTRSYSYGGVDTQSGISRNPGKLLPSFADRLETLFQRMRARGFDPMLHEGWRSAARALELARTKAGIADSLHIYGAAADIISISKTWYWPAFFTALGQEAEKLGLTWGGRFPDVDSTHVQAVKVSQQDALRALAAAPRDAFAARAMGMTSA